MTAKAPSAVAVGAGQRLDRWLFFTRLIKSRTLAAAAIEAGKIRVNSVKVLKASSVVKPGDVVTSAVQRDVKIFKVVAEGVRRGPPAEARTLYEDLTPPKPPVAEADAGSASPGQRAPGSGRPTKRDRRQLDRLLGNE